MEDVNLANLIDRLLDEHRPDRYSSGDKDWMDPVIAAIQDLIPEQTAQRIAAGDKVRAREASATRSANKMLRDIGLYGQLPLDWMDLARRPLAWETNRVVLDECGASDLREWAAVERRRAANDFSARNTACEGAEWLADKIDATEGGDGIRDVL